jgi:predicted amidohydrolase
VIFSLTTIQSSLSWEDKEVNYQLFSNAFKNISNNSSILILPEMFTTGFSMNTRKLGESMDGPSVNWMRVKAQESNIYVAGSLIIKENNTFFNRLVVASPIGEIKYYDKKHLFSYADEHINYSPGKRELIITIEGVKIAFFICYDLRFPLWCRNTKLKYDIAVFVANWPEKRKEHWKTLLKARAIENQSFVVGVNRIGNDGNGINYSGDTAVYNYLGERLSTTRPNEIKVENLSLDIDELKEYRQNFPAYLDADNFKLE